MDEGQLEIPSPFYARILNTYADISDSLYYWSMCKLILQQMLDQLDPRRFGLMILVAQCSPPARANKVRSLRGSVRLGTFPLSHTLEQDPLFFGAEALAGIVASACRPQVVQDLRDENGLLGYAVAESASATGYPILRRGRIAGCLMLASTGYNYFTPNRLALIQNYANILALAFQDEEFYDPRHIELGVMPPVAAQMPYFATFRQRVASTMKASPLPNDRLSNTDAEKLVWQQLEEELLQLTTSVLD